MNKLLVLVFVILSLGVELAAQQEPRFLQFQNNLSVQNNAMAGLDARDWISVTAHDYSYLSSRFTRSGSLSAFHRLKESPLTLQAVYQVSDRSYWATMQTIKLSAAYQRQLNKDKVLSIGVGLGYHHGRTKFFEIYSDFPPYLSAENIPTAETDYAVGFDLGAALKWKKWLFACSINQLGTRDMEAILIEQYAGQHILIRRDFDLGVHWKIQLSAIGEYEKSLSRSRLGALVFFKERYWLGTTMGMVGYNSFQSASEEYAVMGGVDLNGKLRMGYGCAFSPSELSPAIFPRRQEVSLAWMLK